MKLLLDLSLSIYEQYPILKENYVICGGCVYNTYHGRKFKTVDIEYTEEHLDANGNKVIHSTTKEVTSLNDIDMFALKEETDSSSIISEIAQRLSLNAVSFETNEYMKITCDPEELGKKIDSNILPVYYHPSVSKTILPLKEDNTTTFVPIDLVNHRLSNERMYVDPKKWNGYSKKDKETELNIFKIICNFDYEHTVAAVVHRSPGDLVSYCDILATETSKTCIQQKVLEYTPSFVRYMFATTLYDAVSDEANYLAYNVERFIKRYESMVKKELVPTARAEGIYQLAKLRCNGDIDSPTFRESLDDALIQNYPKALENYKVKKIVEI